MNRDTKKFQVYFSLPRISTIWRDSCNHEKTTERLSSLLQDLPTTETIIIQNEQRNCLFRKRTTTVTRKSDWVVSHIIFPLKTVSMSKKCGEKCTPRRFSLITLRFKNVELSGMVEPGVLLEKVFFLTYTYVDSPWLRNLLLNHRLARNQPLLSFEL